LPARRPEPAFAARLHRGEIKRVSRVRFSTPTKALGKLDLIFAHVETFLERIAPMAPAPNVACSQVLFGAVRGVASRALNDIVEKPTLEQVAWPASAIVGFVALGLSSAAGQRAFSGSVIGADSSKTAVSGFRDM
jgi:hypothetical protein